MSEQDLISQLTEQLREATELVHALRGLNNQTLAGPEMARRALLLMKTAGVRSCVFELPLDVIEETGVRLLRASESPASVLRWLIEEKKISIDDNAIYRFANSFFLAVRELLGIAKPAVHHGTTPGREEQVEESAPLADARVVLDRLIASRCDGPLMTLGRNVLEELVGRLLVNIPTDTASRTRARRWLAFRGFKANPNTLYRFAKRVDIAKGMVLG